MFAKKIGKKSAQKPKKLNAVELDKVAAGAGARLPGCVLF